MTALTEVIRRHEAAVSAGSLPSTTYRAGVLTAQQWRGHARKNPGSRLWREVNALSELAEIYGIAGCVDDVHVQAERLLFARVERMGEGNG